MSNQEHGGNLVPAGQGGLAPAAPANPLVVRGMADLAKIQGRDVGEESRHPFKVMSSSTYRKAIRFHRLSIRLRKLQATLEPKNLPGRPPKPQEPVAPLPLLSADEENALAHRIGVGDIEALNQMVSANQCLVVNVARNYTGKGLGTVDLIEQGNLGLLHAAESFDQSMNTRFATYATYWIEQSMERALTKKKGRGW